VFQCFSVNKNVCIVCVCVCFIVKRNLYIVCVCLCINVQRNLYRQLFIGALILFPPLIYVKYHAQNHDVAVHYLGYACTTVSVLSYGSPLSAVVSFNAVSVLIRNLHVVQLIVQAPVPEQQNLVNFPRSARTIISTGTRCRRLQMQLYLLILFFCFLS